MAKRILTGLACLLLLALAACTGGGDEDTQRPRPTVEQRGPAGTVPQGLAQFYGQPLTWGPCQPYATAQRARQLFANPSLQCARLTVPLDYRHPDGATVTLGLLRSKAADQRNRIGSLLINPGGPGESGMLAAAALADQVSNEKVGNRFDLVGFDPRGIGASRPRVDCLTDAEQDRIRAQDLDNATTPRAVDRYEAQQRRYAHRCTERTRYGKQMLEHLGSRDVAKDMDVLRSALGDTKLTFVGFSYGTRIGTAYAELFPRNVRAMVLDGAVDPTQRPVAESLAQARGFQAAFNRFATWCGKRQECPLAADPQQATRDYQQLTRPLLQNPVRLADGRLLTYDDATTGTIQALYSRQFWPILQHGLQQLAQGCGQVLMALADIYEQRGPHGHYTNVQDAFTAVHCVDDPRITDPATLLAQEKAYKRAAPFLDNGREAVAAKDACAYWPVPPTGKPHLPQVEGLPPTLVISTTHDPATPYRAGVALAKALRGRLLTFEATQHTAYLGGSDCIDRATNTYLINLELPPEGQRCSS